MQKYIGEQGSFVYWLEDPQKILNEEDGLLGISKSASAVGGAGCINAQTNEDMSMGLKTE